MFFKFVFILVLNLLNFSSSFSHPSTSDPAVNKDLKESVFYVGTYTNSDILAHEPKSKKPGYGIYSYRFDPRGSIQLRQKTEAVNPAVLKKHPNRDVLYAISERIDKNGTIETFSILDDGDLKHSASFQASGKSSCYFQLDDTLKKGIIVNYWDGFIDVVDVRLSGEILNHVANFRHQFHKNTRQVLTREDHWSNRQVGPHPHSAHFWKNWVFVPDLGERSIFQYKYIPGEIPELETVNLLHKKSGPRHMVINHEMNIAYVSDELESKVIVAKLDSSEPKKLKQRFIPIQYISTLSDTKMTNYVSEIKLTKDNNFLYVSNRGDDSIALFKVNKKDGTLQFQQKSPTGGKFPRHFALDPSEKFLLVANQDSDNIRVFERNVTTGALRLTKNIIQVPSPNFILF